MKRVIALADSHGLSSGLQQAIDLALKRGKVDVVAFLGDGLRDFQALEPALTRRDIQCMTVRGNNDFSFHVPSELVFRVDGVVFYACHGHQWQVKYGLERLMYAAREREAQVALFGHTHQSALEAEYGIYFINPGAVSLPRLSRYAYAEICIQDGHIRPALVPWD